MERIRAREPAFTSTHISSCSRRSKFCQARLPERRHICGRELATACRDLALEQFGVMSRCVLEHWGVRSTADIGDVVYTMVDLGFLISQPTDRRDEFIGVFDFDQAFEQEYPWSGVQIA